MDNRTVFLGILAHFLHPETPLPPTDELTAQQAQTLLEQARIHSVFPICYDALRTTDGYLALPGEQRSALRQEARRTIIGQTVRTDSFLRLYTRILEGGVTPLVVKGVILRSLCAQPDYRISNDEDVLVKPEEFWQLDGILLREGFERALPEQPLQAHEITYWHRTNGLHLEIHLSLFPADSEAYGHLNAPFTDVFDRQSVQQIQGVSVHTLGPTQHMLYLICHGLKHFLHSGFGIRQVMDLVLFAEHYGEQIDWKTVEQWARKQNYFVFWVNLMEIGEKYLGLSLEKAKLNRPADVQPDCENMLEDLLDSGVYGKSSEERIHSSRMTLQAAAGHDRKQGLLSSAFPDFGYMQQRYSYLERHPWMLPLAWGQRMARYLRRGGNREIRETVDTGKRRVELLKQYGLVGKKPR